MKLDADAEDARADHVRAPDGSSLARAVKAHCHVSISRWGGRESDPPGVKLP